MTIEFVETSRTIRGQTNTYSAVFSAVNGAILSLAETGKSGSIAQSGEYGLWNLRFEDDSILNADDCSMTWTACEQGLQLSYCADTADVVVSIDFSETSLEFRGAVLPKVGTVLDFALPARLRFEPDGLERLIAPMNSNESPGMALKSGFFKKQPQDPPAKWDGRYIGNDVYEKLHGGSPNELGMLAPYVTLRVTDAGREYFSEDFANQLYGAEASANCPPRPGQVDVTLLDTEHGPYFSGAHFGGDGMLWRIGSQVDWADRHYVIGIAEQVITHLARTGVRGKLGLVIVNNTRERSGHGARQVHEWRERLAACSPVKKGKLQLDIIETPERLLDELCKQEHLAIVNPYSPWTPVAKGGSVAATADAVVKFVREGGHWFEMNRVPFTFAMEPVEYFSFGFKYPSMFADFFHLDTQAGAASLYRVQPRTWGPYEAAEDPSKIIVPGKMHFGGDDQGGYAERMFCTYVPPGESWSAPVVRLSIGSSAAEGLATYCTDNAITRSLDDKMPPALLDRFKRAVMVLYLGSCDEKMTNIELLPENTCVHFCDYLKGGFDKEYPDHLPPRPECGTREEFREFFDKCHADGHLVMPYTNPTWWCELPKGPTFEREGDAPLLRRLDGELCVEQYAFNKIGYTNSHFHPAIQAANNETIRQFTEDYPIDILFQDQCGARHWEYDTNPASPTPYAYPEGMISMVQSDERAFPLSTEAGWDRVVNHEVQLCGISYLIFPCPHRPPWTELYQYRWPNHLWEVFPMAQYIAHDKCLMNHHDLAQFNQTPETVAWTLGLGYNMNIRAYGHELQNDAFREWLYWVGRLQKSVCSRYAGEPLTHFEHDRGPNPCPEDAGLMRAQYGPVNIVANLGPVVREDRGMPLAAFGFVAEAEGLYAAHLSKVGEHDYGESETMFVVDGTDAWVFSKRNTVVSIVWPTLASGDVRLIVNGEHSVAGKCEGGLLEFRLPERPAPPSQPGDDLYLWHIVLGAQM